MNLFGLGLEELRAEVAKLGLPAFRAKQIHAWLYARRATAIDAMTDLPKDLRAALSSVAEIRRLAIADRQASSDGTVKFLFRLDDGPTIESVFIPEKRRRTICISTQAGCPVKCAFCLTGISGYRRNLKTWEILSQVAQVMDATAAARVGDSAGGEENPEGEDSVHVGDGDAQGPWNIVIMGMGEPLLNYENTVRALRILMDPDAFAVTPKKLTLSTVGILPALEKLKLEPLRPNLAISLHAADPKLRLELMPIEKKYALPDVIAAADSYPSPRGGRVTYEYVLLRGVNDRAEDARSLVKLLRGRNGKVNLIPLNPAPDIPFAAPSREAVLRFERILVDGGVPASIRKARGQDVLAACGQLHLKGRVRASAA